MLKGVVPYKSSTQCKEIKPVNSKTEQCLNTRWLIDNTIYAPIHRDIPEKDQERITKRMIEGYQALLAYGQTINSRYSDDSMT